MERRRVRELAAVAVAATLLGLVVPSTPGQAAGTCRGRAVTILGSEGPDHLRGTDGPDVIDGLGGDDIIEGLGGDDTICGDTGRDTIDGGAGEDTCDGGPGRDSARRCEITYNL